MLLLKKSDGKWSELARFTTAGKENVFDARVVRLGQDDYFGYEWKSCSDCWGISLFYLGATSIEPVVRDKAHNGGAGVDPARLGAGEKGWLP